MTMLAERRPGHWPKVLFFFPSVWKLKQIHMSLQRGHLRFMEEWNELNVHAGNMRDV